MKLMVNGKVVMTDCQTAFEVREKYANLTDLVILNGFQIEEDSSVKEGDTLSIIQKGIIPPKEELESMMMSRHTPQVHNQVKKGRVAIAGLGGLGSNIATMLARIGVGHLLLVDFDVVEPSNLNRQCYYVSHLGMPKTEALKQQIEQINPFIQVETQNIRVTEDNVKELFENYPILCEAFDKPAQKSMLVNTALDLLPDTNIVAASGMAGYDSANSIQTKRAMKRLYLCGDFEHGAKVGRGLMAPRVQICAGHQANMILRLLLGIEEI